MNFLLYVLEETTSDDSRTSSYDDYANQIDAVSSRIILKLFLEINFRFYFRYRLERVKMKNIHINAPIVIKHFQIWHFYLNMNK
jgi:hypothetical protein